MGIDAAWVYDLVRGSKCQVEEPGDGYGRDAVGERHRVADIVDFLQRVACDVQVLLWSNDIHLFSIVEGLANKRHVLHAEKSDIFPHEFSGTTERKLSLPIKGTLSKNRSHQAVVLQKWLNFGQDLIFSLSGRTDYDNVRAWNDILRATRASVDLARHFASMLPA